MAELENNLETTEEVVETVEEGTQPDAKSEKGDKKPVKQGSSDAESIEAGKEVFEEIKNNTHSYYKKRRLKIKEVNWRSKLNHFAFHLSNPVVIFFRNLILKKLVNNKNFLDNYLGRIYKD